MSKRFYTRLTKLFYGSGIVFLLSGLILSMVGIPVQAQASGAIWTTSEPCANPAAQDQNHYAIGQTIFVRADGLNTGETYTFTFTGNPGGSSGDPKIVVFTGTATADSNGYFCAQGYTVQPDDWGEYTVDLYDSSGKHISNDNYRVEGEPVIQITAVTVSDQDCYSADISITVANTGSDTATGVVANISAVPLTYVTSISPETYTIGSLNPGASTTFSVTINTNWIGASAGDSFVVNVNVTSDNASTASGSTTVDFPTYCTPGVSLQITGGGTDCNPVFHLTVTNNGEYPLSGVSVEFSYTSGTEYLSNSSLLTFNIGDLAIGADWTQDVTPPVNMDWKLAAAGAQIDVQLSLVTSDPTVTVAPATGSAINPGGCAAPSLSLGLENTGTACEPVLALSVTNTGDVPVYLKFVLSFTASSYVDPSAGLIENISLAPDDTWTGSYAVPITDAWTQAPSGSQIESQFAVVESNPVVTVTPQTLTITNPGNCAPPELTIDLTSIGTDCQPAYTITVNNTGTTDVTDVHVQFSYTAGTDYLTSSSPQDFYFDLDAGGTWTQNVVVPYNDLWTNGTGGEVISGQAEILSSTPPMEGGIYPPPATFSVTNPGNCAPLVPALDLTLTGGGEDCTPTFTITVENTGEVNISGITVTFSYTDGEEYVDPNTDVTSTFDLVIGDSKTITIDVPVNAAWRTAAVGTTIGVQAEITASTPEVTVPPETGTATNPGDCGIPGVQLELTGGGEDCTPSFTVTLTNNGETDLTGVEVEFGYSAGQAYLTNSSSQTLSFGDLVVGQTKSQTIDVPYNITWTYAGAGATITAYATLTASTPSVTVDTATLDATNPGDCAPAFEYSITAEDVPDCDQEAGVVCIDFLVTLTNLPPGVTVQVESADLPNPVQVSEGPNTVRICTDWPGIGIYGLNPVEVTIDASLVQIVDTTPTTLDETSAMAYYDPTTMKEQCEVPSLQPLLLDDPYCIRVDGTDRLQWEVVNPNAIDIAFNWTWNDAGLTPGNGTALAGENTKFATSPVGAYEVTIYWGDPVNMISHTSNITSCQRPRTPTPTPPTNITPYIVITSTLQPPAVGGEVLIPTTGIDLGGGSGILGFFKSLSIYLGMAFVGMGFIFHALHKRFRP
jgi:hypothetical protein